VWFNRYEHFIDLSAFVLLQNKTLSLNPAKKATLTLCRSFGSEVALPIGSQPAAAKDTSEHGNNDVPTELEPPATEAVASRDEVHCCCIFQLRWKPMSVHGSGSALWLVCWLQSHSFVFLLVLC